MSANQITDKTNTKNNHNSDSKDIKDLEQECLGYMKTKKFLGQWICQQQEKIIFLKYVTLSHSEDHEQMYNRVNNLQQELHSIKQVIYKTEKDDLNLSEEICDKDTYELNKIEKENILLKTEIEKIKQEVLGNYTNLNRIRNQKDFLLNEIKEIFSSYASTDIHGLHNYYKKNLCKENLTQLNMPLSLGIKYNLLSAFSQARYVIESDLINLRIKDDWNGSKRIKIKDRDCIDYEIGNRIAIDKDERIENKINKDFSDGQNFDKEIDGVKLMEI